MPPRLRALRLACEVLGFELFEFFGEGFEFRLELLAPPGSLNESGSAKLFLALGERDLGVGDLLFELLQRQSAEGAQVGVVLFLLSDDLLRWVAA